VEVSALSTIAVKQYHDDHLTASFLSSCCTVSCIGIAIDCFVIGATITLFGEDAADFVEPTGDLIDDAMSSGEFDEGVDDRVVSIRFLNNTSIDRLVGESNNGSDPISTAKELPIWGIVLIVIGALLFAALLSSCPLPCGKDGKDSAQSEKRQQQTRLVVENPNDEEGGLKMIPESSSSFSSSPGGNVADSFT
jgi:hypothetical protein